MDAQTGYGQWTYRIAVQGRLDESWSHWFGGLSVATEAGEDEAPLTVLSGPIVDQPALRGILNRLWDLNLTLISVNRVVKDPSSQEAIR